MALLFFALISQSIHAQTKVDMSKFSSASYKAEWAQIDSFEKKGLPKSALAEISSMLEQARKDNNPTQLVKVLLHKAKYLETLEEEGRVASIRLLEEEVAKAIFPAKQLLHSVLGEIYQNELSNRYWRIRNRTEVKVEENQEADINLWSIGQFVEASFDHYLASLEEQEKLVGLPAFFFEPILQKGTEVAGLRPNTFDFLAHRAIDHFMDDRNYLPTPKESFILNSPVLFSDLTDFTSATLESPDETAYKYQALLIMQKILRIHLAEKNITALIDADLKRLKFVRNQSVLADKDEQYLQALQRLAKKYNKHSVYGEIAYAMAAYHAEQGRQYTAGDKDENQWELKKAHELCMEIIAREKDSYAGKQAKSLKSNLERTLLMAEGEKVYLPNEAGLLLLRYKNTPKVYLKVVKVLEENSPNDYAKYVEKLAKFRAYKSWSYDLPDLGDFQQHSTEVAIPALPFGRFAVVISDNRRFDSKKGKVSAVLMQTSRLAYLHQGGSPAEVLIVDRKTGDPLPGVKMSLFTYDYNNKKEKSERTFRSEATSDKDGLCQLKVDFRGSYFIKLEKGKDELFLNDQNHYNYGSPRPSSFDEITKERDLSTQFFMDRSIYRPGQTLYFKALVVEQLKEGGIQVVANEKVTIALKDVNGQEVAKLDLITNEYGTVNGRFQTPQGGLLGRMSLTSSAEDNYGGKYFRVEEYKRPKFAAEFDPLTGTYALGDEVTMMGTAEGFAGNAIDGAEVSYRVVRQVSFPWRPWWYYGRGLPGQGVQKEIAFGEVMTDETGKFEIKFKAEPDLSISKENKPAFTFTVYADVVDISGETHSASKRVKLAYLGLETAVKLPESIDRTDSIPMVLTSNNLDGQFQAAEGRVEVFPLSAPKQPALQRYWDQPDQYVLKENTFQKLFPLFSYQRPKEKNEWERGTPTFNATVNTADQKEWKLEASDWKTGHYLAVFTAKDDKGNEITSSQAFFLYDAAQKELPGDMVMWQKFDKEVYEPGEQVDLQLATGQGRKLVFLERKGGDDKKSREWLKLTPWTTSSYTITEADRGNVHYKGVSVFQNRIFRFEENVTVPWTNKQLQIEYHTFRDKLLPGQEEEWKVVIKGPKKEAVAAEVVAAMYDASLDEFTSNTWAYFPYGYRYPGSTYWNPGGFSSKNSIGSNSSRAAAYQAPSRYYERLNWFGFLYPTYAVKSMSGGVARRASAPRKALKNYSAVPSPYDYEESVVAAEMQTTAMAPPPPPPPTAEPEAEERSVEAATNPTAPAVRTNLKETVFFMPDLETDEDGNVIIKFKMNEALTKWRFQLFAHTKALQMATSTRTIQTQKDLMVIPNAPRFVRETDEIVYTAKVVNLSEGNLAGNAKLELFDATKQERVDQWFGHKTLEQTFEVKAGQSSLLSWKLQVPKNKVAALTHRVTAQAGSFSDGEESVIPVLSNRLLVTEALTLPLRAKKTETFTLQSLKSSGDSKTLTHQNLSLEFTSNPAWYAVQSLPYLMEYPHDCTEQIFNRFYANTLAAGIVDRQPAVKQMFDQWASAEAFESALAKNESLKQVLLEETPWVFNAQSELQQQKNIALLFDLNKMTQERNKVVQQLADRQSEAGGFSWFPGGRDSWYITQYLLEGMGHLQQLQVLEVNQDQALSEISVNGLQFIDRSFADHYKELQAKAQNGTVDLEKDHLTSIVIHYLYTRSMFDRTDESGSQEEAVGFFLEQAKQFWLKRGLYQQGLLALALHRYGDHATAMDIMRSLDERAIRSKELGMYWKYNRGWFWHELPIETHVLLLEAFAEVAGDMTAVDEMKIWLLKNKQTNHWKTTKATAAAIYGLLGYGENWLTESEDVKITFPKASKKTYQDQIKLAQAGEVPGIGYFKTDFEAEAISADFATIKVRNPNKHIVWGGLYWQYFEDLDAIKTFEETPLKLKKELFLTENTANGPILKAITEDESLRPGSKLTVRIELKVDRDMEYIHMKDMRASGLEPINVLSSYKWQGGLGYYESTKDVATHFFFDYLPKGTYVFEYPLRVVHEGQFSNGVTTIQSMYAPEFTSHSAGTKVEVKR